MGNNLRTIENYAAFMGDFTENNGGIKMNILDQVKELKNMIVLIEEELKKQEAEHGEYELYLCKIPVFNTNEAVYSLYIGFNYAGCFYSVGNITEDGKCFFLNEDSHHHNWELWKENGFKVVEQEPFEWQGLKWFIDDYCLKVNRKRGYMGRIYDFQNKYAFPGVNIDNNFLKKDSEGRIHLF